MNEQVGADSKGVNQKEIRISSLNVEHFVAKISEPDFVSYVKSFDIFLHWKLLQQISLTSARTSRTITCFTVQPLNRQHTADDREG